MVFGKSYYSRLPFFLGDGTKDADLLPGKQFVLHDNLSPVAADVHGSCVDTDLFAPGVPPRDSNEQLLENPFGTAFTGLK